MKKNLLRFPDPAEGAPIVTDQAPDVPAKSPANEPPAARTVIDGEENEELVQTRQKLSKTEREKKEVETRAAELEDENRRLRQVGIKPEPAADTRSALEKFMAGEDV